MNAEELLDALTTEWLKENHLTEEEAYQLIPEVYHDDSKSKFNVVKDFLNTTGQLG